MCSRARHDTSIAPWKNCEGKKGKKEGGGGKSAFWDGGETARMKIDRSILQIGEEENVRGHHRSTGKPRSKQATSGEEKREQKKPEGDESFRTTTRYFSKEKELSL